MFNNSLITALMENEEAQNRLIRQLKSRMWSVGFQGINIDFEYILATDRDAYSEFIEKMVVTMNMSGFEVSVALAPKTSRDQPGVLYEGFDYARLGAAANRVILMTYEWGYTLVRIRLWLFLISQFLYHSLIFHDDTDTQDTILILWQIIRRHGGI